MKRILAAAVLSGVLLPGLVSGKEKKPQEPFYRRYLIAGNALDDQIREQEKRVEANPSSADLRNDFGNLLAARRFPKEARQQYEMAMKLDRSHFLAPYNLGLLYETQGKIGRAIAAYEKSVDRNRGFPPSRFRLGRLYEKRGMSGRAVKEYARALQIDPGMRDPKRNPLVADTRLLDRVSLENYPLDLATASMASAAAYVDPARLRRLPLDRSLSSGDLEPVPPEKPGAAVAPAAPTPVRVIAPSAPARREPPRATTTPIRNLPVAPPPPEPEFVVPPPESNESTAPPLPTPDASGRPLYVGGSRPAPTPTPEQ